MLNPSRTRRPLYVLLPLLFVLLAPARAHAVPVVALVDFNRLVLFDSGSPGTIISSGLVTGIVPGDRLIAIDFRPTTGQLYAFSTGDRIYVIDPQTRAVIRTLGPISPTINGNSFALDFDPARDRLRVINDDAGRQNFLVDPDPATGGGVSVETPPTFAPGDVNAPATPVIHGAAYDNNFLGAAHSRLWAIHRPPGSTVPYLVRIAPGGGGQIRTVGPLLGTGDAAHVTDQIGFDIAPVSGAAYAVLKINSPTITATHLYEVNLATGAATSLGVVGEPSQIIDIAVVPPPLIVYAVNESNELIKFNSATPSNIISRVAITGMLDGEQIYDIDFRPTTDFRPGREELYGVGRAGSGATATSSHIYVINPETGVASPPGPSNALDPALTGVPSLDFNPVHDLIRIVTSAGQNLRVGDLGQVVATATPLAYAAGDPNAGRDPNVLGAAYSNNFTGTTSATLYVIDRDHPGFGAHLARVGEAGGPLAADSGQMFTVAQSVGFGVPVDDIGFDIAPGFEGTGLLSTISMDEGFSRLSVLGVVRAGRGHVGPVGPAGALERLRDLAVAPTATFRFENELTEVVEDCTSVSVNVLRVGDTSNEATVDYATIDRTGGLNQRRNYTAARGTLHFAAGQTSAAIKVLISEDAHLEKGIDHGVPFNGISFELTLTNPSNGHALGDAGNRFTHVRVLDDEDTGAGPNPVNDSHTFVCQHYHDFLGREPDDAGLAFWTNNIESCGTNAGCRAVKRIETSAAFFLSIEFQETGFLVYRTHAAAFGPTRVGGTVPLTLEEFLPDAGRVARGVVVGPGDWQARLENNRRAYFDEFTQRPAFEAAYPREMSAASFVDALNANTGGSLTSAERDALVAALGSGAETRATVLREVVENADFRRRELNRAFVLTQYFGYLRRNPNDHPDGDFGGYNFWLAKLNQFGGDFRAAEMVKAFITSGEYKGRFGNP